MAKPGGQAPSTAGSPVDSQGWPAEDPTANVRATVDQLKDTLDREVAHLEKVGEIRAANLKEVADLRAKHAEAMQKQEAARLDSIRAVDVGAVNQAASVQSTAAQNLATQVALTAETLRTAVAVAAAESASKLAAVEASWDSKLAAVQASWTTTLGPVLAAVDELRRALYEQQGQKAATVETKDDGRALRSALIAVAAILVTLMLGAISIAIALLVR